MKSLALSGCRVLAGQLALTRLVFPADVEMSDVDVLARAPLWAAGLDYRHSTGHGIGAYLAVHERKCGLHCILPKLRGGGRISNFHP